MTELGDIQTFVEVVNQGGFSQAARALGVAKSIVSRRISRLECELGVRLLHRSQRGIAPTESGMDFKLRCEHILSELARAHEAVRTGFHHISGRVRIALPVSFGLRYAAPVLNDWAKAQPLLDIDAAYSDRHVDLLGQQFDAAIKIGVLKDSSMIGRLIANIDLITVASPDYLARYGSPLTPDELLKHKCLIYSGSLERQTWNFQSKEGAFPVLATGRFSADNGEALLQAAQAGLGITVLPDFLVADSIRQGALIPLLMEYRLPREGLYVLRPPSEYVPAKIRALTDLFLARFGDAPPWRTTIVPPADVV